MKKRPTTKPTTSRFRSGRIVRQPTGYSAFIPAPLPLTPPLVVDAELELLRHEATLELGRLDAATLYLPNPDLFLSMYVRKEALLSSQIEGTQASLDDVLEFEAKREVTRSGDASDVVRYVRAMNYGLERIQSLPLSLRLIREIHRELLASGRGAEKSPGDFRSSQNWIGPAGCTLNDAQFVPPPPHEMHEALGNLEAYLHNSVDTILIRCAIAHALFETIHPFLDGNGRVGRLLITLMLCHDRTLSRPLLYLSYYFKANRQEYYDRLMNVRYKGAWEEWTKFFLRGVSDVAKQARETATRITELQVKHRNQINSFAPRSSANLLRLLDSLFLQPITSAPAVTKSLSVSQPTANALLNRLEACGILEELTHLKWRKTYKYKAYLEILREGTNPIP